MASHAINDADHVRAALHHPNLAPPALPDSVGQGSMAVLRQSMARFSHGEDHARKREDVDFAISRIDRAELAAACKALTDRQELADSGGGISPWELASRISVGALAASMNLGLSVGELATVADRVELVVRAIGRGADVGAGGDKACDELLALFDNHPIDAVAGVSVLYQVFDAIVALGKSVFTAEETGEPRGSALAGTVRVAIADTEVGGLSIAADDRVDLAFTTSDQEFGAGTHQCPGAELAWVLIDALRRSNLTFA